jgi:hypothetical protein
MAPTSIIPLPAQAGNRTQVKAIGLCSVCLNRVPLSPIPFPDWHVLVTGQCCRGIWLPARSVRVFGKDYAEAG